VPRRQIVLAVEAEVAQVAQEGPSAEGDEKDLAQEAEPDHHDRRNDEDLACPARIEGDEFVGLSRAQHAHRSSMLPEAPSLREKHGGVKVVLAQL
jgi:hypothetical protein